MPGSPLLGILRPAVTALWATILPSRCAVCGDTRIDVGGGGVCGRCWEAARRAGMEPRCPRCALEGDGSVCRSCTNAPPPVRRAAAAGSYSGVLRTAVLAFKFRGYDILAPHLAARLAEAGRGAGILTGSTLLVGVPSTPARNRKRGFDPAPLLARELGRLIRRPARALLSRRADTAPQSSLPASRRAANVAGAFRASSLVSGQEVVLVDDVMTTGATLHEAARTLARAGARSLDLLVLARTPGPAEFAQPEPQ